MVAGLSAHRRRVGIAGDLGGKLAFGPPQPQHHFGRLATTD
jgi:hypothetical protein